MLTFLYFKKIDCKNMHIVQNNYELYMCSFDVHSAIRFNKLIFYGYV
jgi:hypothetical protein